MRPASLSGTGAAVVVRSVGSVCLGCFVNVAEAWQFAALESGKERPGQFWQGWRAGFVGT